MFVGEEGNTCPRPFGFCREPRRPPPAPAPSRRPRRPARNVSHVAAAAGGAALGDRGHRTQRGVRAALSRHELAPARRRSPGSPTLPRSPASGSSPGRRRNLPPRSAAPWRCSITTATGARISFRERNRRGRGKSMAQTTRVAAASRFFTTTDTGHFTDVTARAGLNVELQGMAAAVGDFDNDGLPDIFITCVGPNHLFHNQGNGTFEDVTETPASAATTIRGAPERRGSITTTTAGSIWWSRIMRAGRRRCRSRWRSPLRTSAAPMARPPVSSSAVPSVYRNLGDGRFELVPGSAGLRNIDPQTGLPAGETTGGRARRCQRRRKTRPAVFLPHRRKRALPQPRRRHLPPMDAPAGRPP